MKRLLALLCSLFIVGLPIAARADVPTIMSSGSITATGLFGQVSLSGQSVCRFRLDGLAVFSFQSQITHDGTNWFTVQTTATSAATGNVRTGSIANPSNAFYELYVGGAVGMRLNVAAYTSGTETYAIACTGAPTQISGSLPYLFDPRANTVTLQSADAVGGVAWMTSGGSTNAAIPAATALQVVKATPGRLVQLLVTTAGTVSATCFDNASAGSGTIIGITPATTTVGQALVFNTPATAGITCTGGAGSPALTASYF